AVTASPRRCGILSIDEAHRPRGGGPRTRARGVCVGGETLRWRQEPRVVLGLAERWRQRVHPRAATNLGRQRRTRDGPRPAGGRASPVPERRPRGGADGAPLI